MASLTEQQKIHNKMIELRRGETLSDDSRKFIPATLTPEGNEILNLLGEAANTFRTLPVAHSHDDSEFVLAIHAAQNIILARVGLRSSGLFGER